MFGGFRFILALAVAAFHLLRVPAIGSQAVIGFFVLSGFLMTLIMHRSYAYSARGMALFAASRALRLYPTYLLACAGTVALLLAYGSDRLGAFQLVIGMPDTPQAWLSNLTMIYPKLVPLNFTPRLAPPSWALTIEILFYALIAIGISRSAKRCWIWFAVSALYVIAAIAFDWGWRSFYGSLISGSLPFATGSLVYFYRTKLEAALRRGGIGLLATLIGSEILLTLALMYVDHTNLDWRLMALGSTVNVMLAALAVVYLYPLRPAGWLLAADRLLGGSTFALYLTHFQFAFLAQTMFGLTSSHGIKFRLIIFFVGTPMAIAFGMLCYLLVDRNVDLLRARFKQPAAIPVEDSAESGPP